MLSPKRSTIATAPELPKLTTATSRVWQTVQATADAVAKDFGKIDFLICSAGVNGVRNLVTKDEPETIITNFQNVVDVNLTGTLRSIAACTKHLIAATEKRDEPGLGPEPDGTSRIVCISSVAGLLTTGGLGYDSSKHGVLAITKGAAAELGPKGVTVNAICRHDCLAYDSREGSSFQGAGQIDACEAKWRAGGYRTGGLVALYSCCWVRRRRKFGRGWRMDKDPRC
jgi:NAD(P)-dependent dehydrogenase (short-subunit alcohol dehydrogenase family)